MIFETWMVTVQLQKEIVWGLYALGVFTNTVKTLEVFAITMWKH